VVLVVRDQARGEEAAAGLRASTGNPGISVRTADLGSASSIKALRAAWKGPLHALVNNAATAPRRREETKDGMEAQWGVNVIGYWRMATAFRDVLSASAPSRLVNVASYWAGGLSLSDPEFRRRPYDNDTAYRQSKQANRLMSVLLAGEWMDLGISVNACHPGDVNSRLSNNLGFGGSASPEEGADTPSWLAADPEAGDISGKWVSSKEASDDEFAKDSRMLSGLWHLLQHYS
jgi:NAD(P)-dependent dehydrogenase (short-subunit alcohol dehydrogenase family)